jgi:hypothetical protein
VIVEGRAPISVGILPDNKLLAKLILLIEVAIVNKVPGKVPLRLLFDKSIDIMVLPWHVIPNHEQYSYTRIQLLFFVHSLPLVAWIVRISFRSYLEDSSKCVKCWIAGNKTNYESKSQYRLHIVLCDLEVDEK